MEEGLPTGYLFREGDVFRGVFGVEVDDKVVELLKEVLCGIGEGIAAIESLLEVLLLL